MQMRVNVFKRPVDQQIKPVGPPGPGRRFIFSLDLALEEIDGKKQNGQHVGTYSGVVTVLREPDVNVTFIRTVALSSSTRAPISSRLWGLCRRGRSPKKGCSTLAFRRQPHDRWVKRIRDHRWHRILRHSSWTHHCARRDRPHLNDQAARHPAVATFVA
jgi:hypothetical protein